MFLCLGGSQANFTFVSVRDLRCPGTSKIFCLIASVELRSHSSTKKVVDSYFCLHAQPCSGRFWLDYDISPLSVKLRGGGGCYLHVSLHIIYIYIYIYLFHLLYCVALAQEKQVLIAVAYLLIYL